MSQKIEPRWLKPEDAAEYIGERVDRLPQLIRAGILKPNYMLGKRKPRYDRLELDAMFQQNNKQSMDAAIIEMENDPTLWATRRKAKAA